MLSAEKLQAIVQVVNEIDKTPQYHYREKPNIGITTDETNKTLLDIKEILNKILNTLDIGIKDTLNHSQAARFLSVSESELYQKASKKEIPYFKPGKFNYYKKSDLIDFMLSQPQ